jgi:hypothetical protein
MAAAAAIWVVHRASSSAPVDAGEAVAAEPVAPSQTIALPQKFEDATGLTISYPAGWTTSQVGGTTTFSPSDAPTDGNGPLERHVLVFQGTARSDPNDAELLASLQEQFTEALPGYERIGEPQRIGGGRDPGALLTFSRATEAEETLAELRLKIQSPIACGLFSIGRADRIRAQRDVANAMFDSLELRKGEHDDSLVGRWTASDSYANSAASFSMASAETVDLARDGRFTRSTQVVGGTGDVEVGSEGGAECGEWFTTADRIVLAYNAGNVVTLQYRFYEGQLVTGKKGSYRFWSR